MPIVNGMHVDYHQCSDWIKLGVILVLHVRVFRASSQFHDPKKGVEQ